jgi:hypothetical protein
MRATERFYCTMCKFSVPSSGNDQKMYTFLPSSCNGQDQRRIHKKLHKFGQSMKIADFTDRCICSAWLRIIFLFGNVNQWSDDTWQAHSQYHVHCAHWSWITIDSAPSICLAGNLALNIFMHSYQLSLVSRPSLLWGFTDYSYNIILLSEITCNYLSHNTCHILLSQWH